MISLVGGVLLVCGNVPASLQLHGNSYTTQFRQYDPRLGRWKSIDPLMSKFPNQSPYAAFNNNPIYFNDPLGLEGEPPGGLPENPNDLDVAPGDNGKNYQWDNENERWVRLQDEATGTGDVKAHYTQKIANLKKELVQAKKELVQDYIRELMFESHERNDGGDNKEGNWFMRTGRFLDELMQGEGDKSRVVSHGNTHTSSDADKSNNAGIEGHFEHTIDIDWFTVNRGWGGKIPTWSTRKEEIENILDGIEKAQEAYEEYKAATGKVDEDGVKSYQEYYEPHRSGDGDSTLVKIYDEKDTLKFDNEKNRGGMRNAWTIRIDD